MKKANDLYLEEKRRRRREEIRRAAKKWTAEGGSVLYFSFTDRITDGQ